MKANVSNDAYFLFKQGFVTDYSLIILIRASRISGTHSYQGVMNAAFGTPGYVLLSILQFIYPFIGTYVCVHLK